MNILRIENAERVGPYQEDCLADLDQELLCQDPIEAHSPEDSDAHPVPQDDGIDSSQMDSKYVCGFASLEHAFEWFEGFLDALAGDGFFLSVYQVSDEHVLVGDHQCMFDPSYAELIEQLSPASLSPIHV